MSGRSTTSKYVKVKKDKETTPENEIRMTGTNYVGKYITYAATLLLEKKIETIVLKATGIATKGACLVAEILRHRIKGLHQLNVLKTITVLDEYEPTEEGLDKVTVDRKLAVLEIFLSNKEGTLDTQAAGYQAPLPEDQITEEDLTELLKRGGGRGGARGGSRGARGERRGGRRGGRGARGGRGGRGGDRAERGDREERVERGERPERVPREGDDRRGPREGEERRSPRGGYRPRGGDRGGDRQQGDREERVGGYRPRGGDRGGDREERGERSGYRPRGGDRGGDREDRGDRPRGTFRGGERGARRGTYRGDRGDRGGNRGAPRGDRGARREGGDQQ